MNWIESTRQKIIAAILKRDSALTEFGLGVSGIVNAAQVLAVDGGKPLAPFLFSAVAWLHWAGYVWVALLTLYGIFALVALWIGLITGNTYFWRSMVSLFGVTLWAIVAVATSLSGQHWIIVFRYGFTAFMAFCVAVILVVKHDYKTESEDTHNARR